MAGRMDRQGIIQQLTVTRDPVFGSEVQTWATLATVWMQVTDTAGREFDKARQTGTQLSVEVRIRYRSDVTPLQRLVVDGRTLEINNVLQVGRRRGLRLLCEEINRV